MWQILCQLAPTLWTRFPQEPPFKEYITSIKLACQAWRPQNLKYSVLKSTGYLGIPILLNPTWLRNNRRPSGWLKGDTGHIILTADKWVSLAGMDRQEYNKKAKIPLEDPNTYKPIPTNPTNKHKNRIIKRVKTEKEWKKPPTRRCILQGKVHQNFMGYQKFVKKKSP